MNIESGEPQTLGAYHLREPARADTRPRPRPHRVRGVVTLDRGADATARAAVLEETQRGVGVRGTGEQVALAELAAERPQSLELAGRLDALGDDGQPERPAERDDGRREGPVLGSVRRADELAGDLQDIDAEAAQVAQR